MKRTKVGVIGNGFVGEAISFAFSTVSEMYIFDTDPLKSLNNIKSVHNCDFVFVCCQLLCLKMDLKIYHMLKVPLKRLLISQYI